MGIEDLYAEKRLHPRISVDIKCAVTFNSREYKGYIINVSRHGLYIKITSELSDHLIKLSTRDSIEVSYIIPSNERLKHECTVRWLFTSGRQLNIGVEALEPPSAFMDFVLHKESTLF